MTTKIIAIGNSRGVRIPKYALEESGLENEVEMEVKKGEIKLIPKKRVAAVTSLSESSLAVEWNTAEEDEAWADL